MPPLVFCRKSDGSLVPAGAASRIVLKIKLGSVCTAERVPTPEDVRLISTQKLQSRECTLLRSLLIQNALDNLDQTNKLGLTPPRPLEPLCYDLPEPWSDDDEEDKENKSSLEDSGVFEMSGSDSEESLLNIETTTTTTTTTTFVNSNAILDEKNVCNDNSSENVVVMSVINVSVESKSNGDKSVCSHKLERLGKGKPLCLKRKEIQSSREDNCLQQQQQQSEEDDYALKLASGGKTAKRTRTANYCGRDDTNPINFGIQYVSCQ